MDATTGVVRRHGQRMDAEHAGWSFVPTGEVPEGQKESREMAWGEVRGRCEGGAREREAGREEIGHWPALAGCCGAVGGDVGIPR